MCSPQILCWFAYTHHRWIIQKTLNECVNHKAMFIVCVCVRVFVWWYTHNPLCLCFDEMCDYLHSLAIGPHPHPKCTLIRWYSPIAVVRTTIIRNGKLNIQLIYFDLYGGWKRSQQLFSQTSMFILIISFFCVCAYTCIIYLLLLFVWLRYLLVSARLGPLVKWSYLWGYAVRRLYE